MSTYVVTGATRGLGRALLTEFAAAGHTVCGCGRDTAGIENLRREFPPPHRFASVNVVLLAYAMVRFVGLRESAQDIASACQRSRVVRWPRASTASDA